MSWKDSLENFDAAWKRHLRWRTTADNKGNQNSYVRQERSDIELVLRELPDAVRARVIEKVPDAMRVLVDYVHAIERRQLVALAVDEARETILKLEGAGAAPPKKDLPAAPEDPTVDVTRLGAALASIGEPEVEEQ